MDCETRLTTLVMRNTRHNNFFPSLKENLGISKYNATSGGEPFLSTVYMYYVFGKRKLRLVDDDYLFRIFSQVLGCVYENSRHPREIDKDIVIDTLSALAESFFLEKIFQWFLEPVVESCANTSEIKYTFKQNEVCRFLGETLLKSMGKFNMNEFMKVWDESVPEGLKTNLQQLNGIAVFDQDCSPPLIWHFPEYNLPELFTGRLALLFETKRRWKLEEISPFIEISAPPSQNVGNLLTKYARSTTVNGTKYYSSKHGK